MPGLEDWVTNPGASLLGGLTGADTDFMSPHKGLGDALYGDKREYPIYHLDPSVGLYGGKEGAYDARYGQLEGERGAANQGVQNDYGANVYDRNLQLDAVNSYKDVLSGKAPSLAEMQMRQGTQSSARNAENMAASARGGGGNQLMAQQMAQRQNAMASQDANMQAGMLRAKEQDAARGGLAGTAGQMRAGDLQSRGQSLQQSQGLMGAQQSATEHRDAQQMGLATLNSQNFNATQAQQQTQDSARDQRKTDTVKGAASAAGPILSMI